MARSSLSCRRLAVGHASAGLGAFLEDLRADLAVFGVVALTLRGALLTRLSTRPGKLGAVARTAGHEARV